MNALVARLRARPATLAAAALVVLAAWEIGVLAHSRSAAPRDADWQAAARFVDGEFAPGDLIVFAPLWVDPVGRRWLGRRISLDDAARMDTGPYARVWEVSIRGARAPETRGLGAAELDRAFGAVRVRRFTKPAATVVWRPHQGGEILEVDHQPRRCMRMMGKKEFKGAELGAELQVYAGLGDVWTRKENRAYVNLVVSVDGVEQARATVGNDSGWVALPAIATTPGLHDVAIEATIDPARGDPKKARLQLCIAAEGRTFP